MKSLPAYYLASPLKAMFVEGYRQVLLCFKPDQDKNNRKHHQPIGRPI
jgi:hypothetical protein